MNPYAMYLVGKERQMERQLEADTFRLVRKVQAQNKPTAQQDVIFVIGLLTRVAIFVSLVYWAISGVI